MQKLLDGIERLGNKMPNPAILFLWLCLGVILLSQVLSWLDVKATYEVVAPPPVPAEETYYGGSVYPSAVAPPDPPPAEAYEVRTETAEVKACSPPRASATCSRRSSTTSATSPRSRSSSS
jgi:aminobenzoyl-glutamate transport protein